VKGRECHRPEGLEASRVERLWMLTGAGLYILMGNLPQGLPCSYKLSEAGSDISRL
jgi:hypothetical protein